MRQLLAIYFPTYIKLQDVSRHCPSASPSGKALKAVYCRNAESPRLGVETQTTQLSLIELNTYALSLADSRRI